MVDVVSIKFKTCGKVYYFDPNGTSPKEGERVVVETANGRELAICSQGVHAVADDRVIQPLQPVVRVSYFLPFNGLSRIKIMIHQNRFVQ